MRSFLLPLGILIVVVVPASACNPVFPIDSGDTSVAADTDTDTDADTDSDTDADSDSDSDTNVDPLTTDDDGDGYTENGGDCNDADATVYPGAAEVCDDGVDQDCDGADSVTSTGTVDGMILRFNATYVGQEDWLCYGYVPNGTAEIDQNADISVSVGTLTWDTSDVGVWSPPDGTVSDGCSAVLEFGDGLPASGDIVLEIQWPYSMETELTFQQVTDSADLGSWWEPSVVTTGSSTTATIHYDHSSD